MTNQVSFAILITVVLPFLFGSQIGKKRPLPQIFALVVGYIILLLFPLMTRENWLVLLTLSVLIIGINVFLLMKIKNPHLAGTILLIFNLAIVIGTIGNRLIVEGYAGWIDSTVRWLTDTNQILAEISIDEFRAFLFGAAGIVFVSFGLNDPIVLILKSTHLMPGNDSESGEKTKEGEDSQEPARGRVIGYLERGIILVLMLSGNSSGIGFVLAAKGFARFKQLEDRDFAEYFLIGTLLSVGVTMLVGLLMKVIW